MIIYYRSHPLQEPEKSIDLALTQMGIQQISASVECKDNKTRVKIYVSMKFIFNHTVDGRNPAPPKMYETL